MTVDELIRALAKYPPDLRVVVNGYEDGYDDVAAERISLKEIALDVGKESWEGKHGDGDGLGRAGNNTTEVVEALVLARASN